VKAVIMAGGEGSRLRPLTSNCPKPMMPLANRPMMEYVLDLLVRHGITDVVVTVAYMADTIRNYFGDGSDFGVSIAYSTEEVPLGTAGSVRNARAHLDERFVVISGDVLTDIDLGEIIAAHERRGALATIGLVRVPNPLEFGIVITAEDGSIERFLEKPSWGQVFSDTINSGVFVCEPEVLDHIEPDRAVDFSGEVFPSMLDAGLGVYGAVADGYWEDVGTLEAYLRAHRDLLDGRVDAHLEGFEVSPGVRLGENTTVHPEAIVEGPAVIGDNCRVEAGARLGPYTVLGSGTRVGAEADLERSVIGDNTYVAEGVRVAGTVLGRRCDLRRGSRTDEGVVVGDECFVGEYAHLTDGVKVYPFKTIESGAVVNASIVWESRGARQLFTGEAVTGLANVDVTPEFATRVAMAWGSTLRQGVTVVSSRDSSRTARMLKRAMMAGLNAAGVSVEDLEVASVPITRWIVRRPNVSGGFTVRLNPDDPNSAVIRLFDADGLDLADGARRKVERLFDREDVRRVFPAEIGEIGFAPRALEHYATAVASSVDADAIASAGFKVVVDFAYGSTSFAMPNVLAKLGLEALAVNPFMSTAGMLSVDLEEHAKGVGDLVRTSGSHLGAVFEPGGERLRIVDDRGRVLSGSTAQLVLLRLWASQHAGAVVALPVTASDRATEVVVEGGGRVALAQVGPQALMTAARSAGVGFAADDNGGFVLPGFLPSFDATAAFAALLELLAASGRRLSDHVDELPEVHIVHDTVVTPWDLKGQVMRSLVERSAGSEVELVDGVKVRHPGGWALALPDPTAPVTHLWAEGASDEAAAALVAEYARRIEQMVR
jgi:mannose-1-phosphate guanylyltransferase/phosphomannomutase